VQCVFEPNDFSFWQCKLFIDIQSFFLENCHQTGVGWLKSKNLQFCCIFISLGNMAEIIVHYYNAHSGFLPTPDGIV